MKMKELVLWTKQAMITPNVELYQLAVSKLSLTW